MPSNAAEDEPGRPDDENEPKAFTNAASSESGDPPPSGARASADSEMSETSRGSGKSEAQGAAKQKKQRSFWKELPILIVVALVLAFFIQQFVARVYMIPSGSMQQTLHGCPGCTPDRILVDKVTYHFTDPAPGDVVVFRGPGPWVEDDPPTNSSDNPIAGFFQNIGSAFGLAPPDERDFVKRIIATGGQTVECCDEENRVMVDGEPLHEPYIYWQGEREQPEFGPVTVPEGTLWVMGDNRNNSADSRYQGGGGERGVVPEENIIGKARLIVLPPSRWDVVSDHNPQESAETAAMSAPAWQQGLPLAAGVLAAWPTLFVSRKIGAGTRRVVTRLVGRER
ncbi:signal peptidase I [Saccharomonospora sp.]|uniref:signal peptidase I n=1 Tax=Saccharomonospora sp. TaxID=33913 RepID=UPI002630A4BE|nr:signal peptidase I [Saccharomonospora sp.]